MQQNPPSGPYEKRIDLYSTAFESPHEDQTPPPQAQAERKSYGIPTSELEYDGIDPETRSQSPSNLSELSRVSTETYIVDLANKPYHSPASKHLLRIIQEEEVAPASSLGLALLSLMEQLQVGGKYNPIVVDDLDGKSTTGITEGVKAALGPVHDRLNDFAAMLNTIAEAVGVDLLENDDEAAANPLADAGSPAEADLSATRPIGSQVALPGTDLSRQVAESSPTLLAASAADPQQSMDDSLSWNRDRRECVATTATVATEASDTLAISPSGIPLAHSGPDKASDGAAKVTVPGGLGDDVGGATDRPSHSKGKGREEQDQPRRRPETNMFVNTDNSKTETVLEGGEFEEKAVGPSEGKKTIGQNQLRRRPETNMFINNNTTLLTDTNGLGLKALFHPISPSSLASPTLKPVGVDTTVTPVDPRDSPKTTRERLQEILEEAEKLAPDGPGRSETGRGASTRNSVHWPEEALKTDRAAFIRPSDPTDLSIASRTVNVHALIPWGPESVTSDGDDTLPSTASSPYVSPFSEPGPRDDRPSWWRNYGIPRHAPWEPQAMPLFGPGAYAMGYPPFFHDQPPMGSPPWGSVDPRPGMFAHMPAYPGMHNRWIPTWRWHVPNGHPFAYGPAAPGSWGRQSSGLVWD